MAAELELKVDSNKYAQRIAMLEGHVKTIEGLMDEYTALKNRVSDFMGDDDNVETAQKAAQIGIDRCNKAIAATQVNIKSIQDTMNNMENIGTNVKTILETAVEFASKGLFD